MLERAQQDAPITRSSSGVTKGTDLGAAYQTGVPVTGRRSRETNTPSTIARRRFNGEDDAVSAEAVHVVYVQLTFCHKYSYLTP